MVLIRNVAAGVYRTNAVNVPQLTQQVGGTISVANAYTDFPVQELHNDAWRIDHTCVPALDRRWQWRVCRRHISLAKAHSRLLARCMRGSKSMGWSCNGFRQWEVSAYRGRYRQ